MSKLVRPIGDRVIIRRVAEKEKSTGGIIIPQTAQDAPTEAVVLAVGDGRLLEDGITRQAPEVSVGAVVLVGKYVGTEIEIDEEKVVLLREEEIHSIVYSPSSPAERQHLLNKGAAEIGKRYDDEVKPTAEVVDFKRPES